MSVEERILIELTGSTSNSLTVYVGSTNVLETLNPQEALKEIRKCYQWFCDFGIGAKPPFGKDLAEKMTLSLFRRKMFQ